MKLISFLHVYFSPSFFLVWINVISQTFFYHFHHFWIIKVVDNMLQDVSVRHEAECSEHNNDGDLLFDVWKNANDPLSDGAFLGSL